MQKLYCYVDETGQDTRGAFFLVALVILGKTRDPLRKQLSQIERRSGKITRKWKKATLWQRAKYLREIFTEPHFNKAFFYQTFSKTTHYLPCFIQAISNAIAKKAKQNYKAVVLIDGFNKHDCIVVGSRLRARRVLIEKVRGLRDESDEFIRLADAIAGFVRDARDGKKYAQELYKEAVRNGFIEELL
jgi:hypothetical protein